MEPNTAVVEWEEVKQAKKDVKDREDALKMRFKELTDKLGSDNVVTDRVKVKRVQVKGRRSVDLASIAEQGIEIPYKTGKPSERWYVTNFYGPSYGEKDSED
jgi:hypothetical protein